MVSDVAHHGGEAVGGEVPRIIVKNELPGLRLHQAHQQLLQREAGQHILIHIGGARHGHQAAQRIG